MITLPEKASDLIELALADLEKVEQSALYAVDMSLAFHSGSNDVLSIDEENGPCFVCFAGAVMAKSLGVFSDTHCNPDDFPPHEESRLNALDMFRLGYVDSGLANMSGLDEDYPSMEMDRTIPKYRHDKRGFKTEMRKLALDLRAKGL